MEWKPNRWIAATLSLLITPWGLFYVQRAGLALGYLALAVGLQVAIVVMMFWHVPDAVAIAMGLLAWGVAIGAAVHAFRIAKASSVTSTRRWYSRWSALVGIPAALVVVLFLVRAFFYEPFRLPSESMHPTVPKGSIVAVKKLGYGDYGTFGIELRRAEPTAAVARGDLILFRLGSNPGTFYLKRVIGLPGDRVECHDQRLFINGAGVPTQLGASDGKYQYATETIGGRQVTIALMPTRSGGKCDAVVPEGHYFVLGDNRDNSRDSRHLGMVPRKNLVGRAVTWLAPANQQPEH